MVTFISIILYLTWIVVAIFCPIMLCGYDYGTLLNVIQDSDGTDATEFMRILGLVDENSAQIASKYFVISIVIVVVTLVAVILITKLLKKYNYVFYPKEYYYDENSENRQNSINKTSVDNQVNNINKEDEGNNNQ